MAEGVRTRRTVALRSIGCRTNQQELGAIAAQLAAAGFQLVRDLAQADIVVVNTCCVTAAAEAKTRRFVARIPRENPGACIVVTGCCAQLRPELYARLPSVRWVVSNSHKSRIASLLRCGGPGIHCSAPSATPEAGTLLPRSVSAVLGRTRLLVKIQEGCDFRCTYCIVPFVRGPSRSVSASDIIELCRRASEAGVREMVLTGTHIGQYRDETGNLEYLCGRLADLAGDFRIRLSSLDPRDLSEGILALVGGHPRFCPHLHVSVQSMSPDVVRMMGRDGHEVERLAERLAAFRSRYPQVAVGGDFIVGFPGETDTLFQAAVERAANAGFTYGHVFRFSARPGTPASRMTPQVPPIVIARRHALLSAELRRRTAHFLDRRIGMRERLVVERTDPVRGLTGNYIRVRVPGGQARAGEWLDVRLTERLRGGRDQCLAVVADRKACESATEVRSEKGGIGGLA